MRLHRTTVAVLAVASVGVLGACTSTPSEKAVVKDVVQSIGLSEAEETCMLEVVDAISEDDLQALGEANVSTAIEDPDSGTPEMQAFIADLDACRASG